MVDARLLASSVAPHASIRRRVALGPSIAVLALSAIARKQMLSFFNNVLSRESKLLAFSRMRYLKEASESTGKRILALAHQYFT